MHRIKVVRKCRVLYCNPVSGRIGIDVVDDLIKLTNEIEQSSTKERKTQADAYLKVFVLGKPMSKIAAPWPAQHSE